MLVARFKKILSLIQKSIIIALKLHTFDSILDVIRKQFFILKIIKFFTFSRRFFIRFKIYKLILIKNHRFFLHYI